MFSSCSRIGAVSERINELTASEEDDDSHPDRTDEDISTRAAAGRIYLQFANSFFFMNEHLRIRMFVPASAIFWAASSFGTSDKIYYILFSRI